MHSIRILSSAFVLGLAATACSGDSDRDSYGSEDVPVEEVPALYAEALCSAYTNCMGDLLDVLRPGEDCVKNTTVRLEEELAELPDLVADGRIVYDADQLRGCLDEITAADCELLDDRAPESCEAALRGTVPEGSDCQLDVECEGERYCKLGASCPGTCAPLEQAGGTCQGNDDCVSGLVCGETGRCVAPAKAGENCKGGEPDCVAGYLCLGNDDAGNVPGTCVEISSAFSGEAGDDCSLETRLCASGYSCEITEVDPIGGTCVAKVGSGDACRAAFPDACPDDEFCQLDGDLARPFDGTCTSRPAVGESCAKGLGPQPDVCAPYARCEDGVCRAIANLGESCSVDATCYSDHCVDGACVAANSCE